MKRSRNLPLRVAMSLLLALTLCACSAEQSPAEQSHETEQTQEQTQPESSATLKPPKDTSGTLQFQLGSSGYAMDVPDSYRNGDVTMDELQSNQIAYYYSPNSEMDFDIYQFPKPEAEMDLESFVLASAADFDGSEVRMQTIHGIDVGSYKSRETYDGVEYDVLVALMEDAGEYVEVVFWLDGESAEQDARNILSTLSQVETYDLQLGDSPFYLTIPAGYKAGPVTEEEAADDMVGYYYSESSPLDFDVYQWGKKGYTLEKYAIEEANTYEAERVDYRTINGIDLAFYYSYEESEGEMYTVANYLFEYGDDFMEIAFWLDGEIAVKQTDRILSTLKRADG